MARNTRPPAGADPLPGLGPRRPARKGRLEAAVDRAVLAGYHDDVVSKTLDAGAVTLARTLARQLDHEAARLDSWAVARLSGELRAVLAQLRLDPASRGGMRRDEFADLVARLARPATAAEATGPPDDPGTGPADVSHPAQS